MVVERRVSGGRWTLDLLSGCLLFVGPSIHPHFRTYCKDTDLALPRACWALRPKRCWLQEHRKERLPLSMSFPFSLGSRAVIQPHSSMSHVDVFSGNREGETNSLVPP